MMSASGSPATHDRHRQRSDAEDDAVQRVASAPTRSVHWAQALTVAMQTASAGPEREQRPEIDGVRERQVRLAAAERQIDLRRRRGDRQRQQHDEQARVIETQLQSPRRPDSPRRRPRRRRRTRAPQPAATRNVGGRAVARSYHPRRAELERMAAGNVAGSVRARGWRSAGRSAGTRPGSPGRTSSRGARRSSRARGACDSARRYGRSEVRAS